MSFVRRRTSALVEALLISVIVAMVAGLIGWSAFTLAAPRTESDQETLEGTLSIRHGDDFAHGREVGHAYFIANSDGETQLSFTGNAPDHVLSGQPIRVQGSRRGKEFLVEAGGMKRLGPSSGSRTSSTGAKSLAVVLFNFSNNPAEPYAPSYAAGVAFNNADSVAAYYAETSWGQLTISGEVFGWFTLPETDVGCATGVWAASATTAATAAGINLAAYDHVVYGFPSTAGCPWSGLASMPGRSSWLNGTSGMTLHTMAHELGHNFGTHHASSLSCTENGARVALASNCTTAEYGDPFSVMGSGSHYQHTNFSRANFGWLSNANTVTATTAGDYSLTPIENDNSTAVKVLRIPRADTGTYLTLEFRQPFGEWFDTFSSIDPVTNGVTVRLAAGLSVPSQTRLVDATPATLTFADAPLPAGQTLIDPVSSVGISTTSVSASGATVHVSFDVVSPSPSPVATAVPTPSATSIPTVMPTASPTPAPTASPPSDTEAPTSPGNLAAARGRGKKVALSWVASTDNVAVAGYWIFRDGVQMASTSANTFTDSLTGKGAAHTYYVVAFDLAGNRSPPSNAVSLSP
jgi:hypothetical protein